LIAVVCFKWFDPNGRYNTQFLYTAEHVNRLHRMVRRHLAGPHHFVCITDDPGGMDAGIRTEPIDREILLTAGRRYAKLMVFRPDAPAWLGDRILLLDLDTVVLGPLDPLLETDANFQAWREPGWGKKPGRGKYNTSLVLLRAGAHPEVWNQFVAKKETGAMSGSDGFSDQAHIADVLGEKYPVWTRADGVLSFKVDIARQRPFSRGRDLMLPTRAPPNARVVFFHGGVNMSDPAFLSAHPWVRENWR